MTLQKSFFDEDGAATARGAPIAVAGSPRVLTREQKQFNRLIRQISDTRREIEMWRAFFPEMQRVQLTEVPPLLAQLREKRKALAALLHSAMGGKGLGKGERRKVADMLRALLRELLAETVEPELVKLYNQYSGVTYEAEQAEEAALLQALAGETFGVKLDAEEIKGTADEVAHRIHEKLEAKELKREARRAERSTKKNPQAAAREAAREQAARGASNAVREVYRKLASELHPDREPDAAERERKTALMQRVNKAYEASDLLALLELQLEIEQINPADLSGMARERLVHFNTVLTGQLQRLREELEEITVPFALLLGEFSARDLSPETVRQELAEQLEDLRESLRAIENDLSDFADISKLKQSLKHYQVGAADTDIDELAFLDELLAMTPPPRGWGRRR